MMKRKDYQKPMAKTVKLQLHRMLTASSVDQLQGNSASMPQGVEAEEF
jgi:hypothetical protein